MGTCGKGRVGKEGGGGFSGGLQHEVGIHEVVERLEEDGE